MSLYGAVTPPWDRITHPNTAISFSASADRTIGGSCLMGCNEVPDLRRVTASWPGTPRAYK
jgi:hypothetical protein